MQADCQPPGVLQTATSQCLFGYTAYASYHSSLPATLRGYVASHAVGLGYHGSTVLRGTLLAMRSVSNAGNQIKLPYYSLQIMVISNGVASLSCS